MKGKKGKGSKKRRNRVGVPRAAPPMISTIAPDLHDVHGQHHLLVWGELGQWLVVDEELSSLLNALDGETPFVEVLRVHAQHFGKSFQVVEAEAQEVLQNLRQRGIVSSHGRSERLEPTDPISIANVTINLTNKCNLKCPFCYNIRRRTPEMPIGEMMDALEVARGVLEKDAAFIILGGEPTLAPERLFSAIDRGSKLFIPAPLVSTNGTLLTPEIVAKLARRRVEVQVSIDSYDPVQHDRTRGIGVYDKAIAGIGRLVDVGVHTIISMVYDARSFIEIEPYLDLALELGVDEARLIPMRLIGGGLDMVSHSPDQWAVFKHLLDVLERRPELRTLLGRDFFSIITAICRTSAQRKSCGIGKRVIFLDADGKVYPCPNHVGSRHLCGDLGESELTTIIKTSPVMEAIRNQYRIERYPECLECPFRRWCAGDCRGEVVALHGDPSGPAPHCSELKEVYLQVLWLLAEGDARLTLSRAPSNEREARNTFQ